MTYSYKWFQQLSFFERNQSITSNFKQNEKFQIKYFLNLVKLAGKKHKGFTLLNHLLPTIHLPKSDK